MRNAFFLGTGAYLPKKSLTNDDLSLTLDTTDDWIVRRTGIRKRYIASDFETTSYMATAAAKDALSDANVESSSIDMIVIATTTPDKIFPSCATMVQANLKCVNAFAFDVQAVCCGFIYAVSIVEKFIRSFSIKRALVIGSESMSKILDWNDRSTCVLFGDGAGAVVIDSGDDSGIISTKLFSDGNFSNLLYTSGGISSDCSYGVVKMDGKAVFEHAVAKLASSILKTLKENELTIEDIDWFIPHQANIRIIQFLSKKLHISWNKIVITIDEHANTSAASIPIAFNFAKRANKFKKGQVALFFAIGAGLTWGTCLSYI